MTAQHSEGEKRTHMPREEMVQLGDLSAPATCTDGEVLEIRLSLSSLGSEQLRLVQQLKSKSHAISVTLPYK